MLLFHGVKFVRVSSSNNTLKNFHGATAVRLRPETLKRILRVKTVNNSFP